GKSVFRWEGVDGSRVLAFNEAVTSYNGIIAPENLIPAISKAIEDGNKEYLFSHGIGDHGGGPARRDLRHAEVLRKDLLFPELRFSSPEEFFKYTLRSRKNHPVIKDELNFVFDGCYTTHADIKYMNRRLENDIPVSESFSAIAGVYGFKYNKDAFEKSWRGACFNQFHDILDGSAIHPAYEYSKSVYEEAKSISSVELNKSVDFLSSLVKYESACLSIIVFNPLAWQRQGAVEVEIDNETLFGYPNLYDNKGKSVPYQKTGSKVCFFAKGVPGMGYSVYYLKKEAPALPETGKKGENNSPDLTVKEISDAGKIREYLLENEFLRVKVNPENGCIHGIFNKKIRKEFILERSVFEGHKLANMFQVLHEKPHVMSSWIIGEIERVENLIKGAKVEIGEKGPVFVSVKVTIPFGNSKIAQEIRLYGGSPQIYFITEVDWHEIGGKDTGVPMLKVAFPMDIITDKVTCEIPFGYIERPANGREIPALKWVDISEKNCGVSLLNDSKYGYDVQGNSIRLTLLRNSYDPDHNPDEGLHKIVYALYPHSGGWRNAKITKCGYELNVPFIAASKEHAAPSAAGDLPVVKSFIEVQPSNLVLTAFKKAEEDETVIIRIYEAEGKPANGKINIGIPSKHAVETDLMEKPIGKKKLLIKNNKLKIRFKPYEIKTFKIKV
ncbi:MAG: alpha-mannosidase, partial [Candidatus Omnitrophica bacterium]|nr:alpha-mannosidase [Candidatus Omnitrophota bacterium]